MIISLTANLNVGRWLKERSGINVRTTLVSQALAEANTKITNRIRQ